LEVGFVGLLLGLSPFLAFFFMMRLVSPIAGLLGALLVSGMLCAVAHQRGKSIKVLEFGSLILFAILALYTFVAAPQWTVATVRLAVDSGLLAITVVSLVIGRPFTIQYAREQVSEQFWDSPQFIAANRMISTAWVVAFAVLVAADAAAEYMPSLPVWVDIAASIAALLAAGAFTIWYPAAVRRRAASAVAGLDRP
jgi:hypothetical protein